MFTWKPAYPGEQPPQQVVVVKSVEATYGDALESEDPWVAHGQADDGFGDDSGDYFPSYGPFVCHSSSGTHYSVQAGGQTLTVHCSPSASASPDIFADSWFCWTGCSVDISPVTIALTGTTQDSGGNQNLLTGQQVKATLNGTVGTVTSYTWSAGGSTFKDYDTTAPNSTNATQLVPLGSADLTGPAAGGTTVADLYFYDGKQESVTVSCNATMTAPDGTSLSVSVTAPSISVKKPTTDWAIGQVVYGVSPGFYSDQTTMGPAETWGPITITEPPPFGSNGSQNSVGTGVLVQIAAPSLENTGLSYGSGVTYNKIQVLYPDGTMGAESSPTGLDGGFPFPFGYYLDSTGNWVGVNGNYAWIVDNIGYSGDAPKKSFQGPDSSVTWTGASATESSTTWVMYRPPTVGGQGTVYVPLQMLTWSWGGSASLNLLTDIWSASQTQPLVPGSPTDTNTPPSWSLTLPINPTLSQ